jgi:primase-polymerase (primpol)-like protein
MLKPQFDNIPAELTLVDRWVCWGGGKRPFSPSTGRPASIKKASDWSKFHTAKATYTRGGFDGVGLVLTGDGLVGIDIDKCVTSNGEPEPAAIDLLHDMGVGYSELSPSGTGLRSPYDLEDVVNIADLISSFTVRADT